MVMNKEPNLTTVASMSPVDGMSSTAKIHILVLPNGMMIHRLVLDAAETRALTLEHGKTLSLPKMAGPEIWGMLDPYEKILNGETFAYLVASGQLPLEFACCPHRSNKKYRRK